MLVFAAMFHVYRYGRARAKAPPPKPVPPTPSRPVAAPTPAKPAPATTAGEAQKPMAAPPTVATRVSSEQTAQLAQQQQKHTASERDGGGSTKTGQTFDRAQPTPDASKESQDKKTL